MRGIVLAGGKIVHIVRGNITEEQVDAIVNPANEYLRHGAGVAGAIVRAGGKVIQEQSTAFVRKNGPVDISGIAVTGAGSLPCKYVIHVCGPRYGDEDVESKLYLSFFNVLKRAGEIGIKTISIPAVSSGIFGVPKKICANSFFEAVIDYFESYPDSVTSLVRACNIDRKTTEVFEQISESFIPR